MNCHKLALVVLAFIRLAAPSSAADSSLDASIAKWTDRALAYVEKVPNTDKHRTAMAFGLVSVLAKQGKAKQAIEIGRGMTDKSLRHDLACKIGPYCKVEDAIALAEESTEQKLRDWALQDIALHHAQTEHPELAETFLKRISPERATDSRYAVVCFLERRKNFQQALDVWNQAKPQTKADRWKVEVIREWLAGQLREHNAKGDAAQPENNLTSELAAAQRDAHNASRPRDASDQGVFAPSPESNLIAESEAWHRVATVQRKLDRRKECNDALVRAEAVADKTTGLERAWLLADIVDTYRVLGDRDNVRRVAQKNLKLLRARGDESGASLLPNVVDPRLEPIQRMKLLESIARGELNEAIGIAIKYETWFELGVAATIDDAILVLLEKSLDRVDSNAVKTMICTGVIGELLKRRDEVVRRPNKS